MSTFNINADTVNFNSAALTGFIGGNWTPSAGTHTGVTGTATYSNGRYIQIGNFVMAQCRITGLSCTSGSQVFIVTSLPVNVTSNNGSFGGETYITTNRSGPSRIAGNFNSNSNNTQFRIIFTPQSTGTFTAYVSLTYMTTT